jgi:putative endonuclease
MCNWCNTVLYTGISSDLHTRVFQHKQKYFKGFTSRYNINKLVYYECFEDVYNAICREKQIKAGSRAKKIALIEKRNPEWKDLSTGWFGE